MGMEDIFDESVQKEDVKSETPPEVVAEVPALEPAPESIPEPEKPKVEPPVQELTEKERAFLAKANDEKSKRQALEQRIAELEGQKPKAEFWENPEAALKTLEDKVETLVINSKLNTSEAITRSKFADFDEKMNILEEMIQQTPYLAGQIQRSDNPAEYAYKLAKNHLEIKQAGNLDEIRAKIEKETRIKLEAEFKAKEDAKNKQLEDIPDSLSNVRSTGANKPVWSGPPTLDDVLK